MRNTKILFNYICAVIFFFCDRSRQLYAGSGPYFTCALCWYCGTTPHEWGQCTPFSIVHRDWRAPIWICRKADLNSRPLGHSWSFCCVIAGGENRPTNPLGHAAAPNAHINKWKRYLTSFFMNKKLGCTDNRVMTSLRIFGLLQTWFLLFYEPKRFWPAERREYVMIINLVLISSWNTIP